MVKPLKLKDLQKGKSVDPLDGERLRINAALQAKYDPTGFSVIHNVEHLKSEEREQLVRDYSHFDAKLYNGQYNDESWTFEILWFPNRK